MSKKDKHRDDAARRRDFVIGLDRAGGWVEDRDPPPGPDAALPEPQDRSEPKPPSARREAIADEIRGMALEMVEECAQLSSLAVRLAAIDEASDEARTLARDALGASAAARGVLFALLRHVEVVPRDDGPWHLLVPPGRGEGF
ncbi:MAG: hypothetical protein O2865_08600 [Planctomycetota bacterium]|nr:hypothetical protein [Planctomycetota bacterium]MDA0933155.1 hypothetical protein [Planctomycetota bacterium]MDA1220985.1 hypothetical protein [Planctomycetota bacterium]